MMRAFVRATLCLAAVGCVDARDVAPRAEARLVGTWDARFDIAQSPLDGGHAAGTVDGRISFLANRWLEGRVAGIASPTDYGSYDVDFRPLGFDPRKEGRTPTAIAGSLPDDSIAIVLGDADRSVSMRGRLDADSITGTWDASLGRADAGAGRFVMRRAP